MAVKNCARCGKMFSYMTGAPLCLSCKNQDEEEYKKVKEFLYDNPGATMPEVSEAVDVTVSKIKRFLKEGRLEIKENANFFLECERCSVPIKSGQYCENCSHILANEMKSAFNKGANKSTTDQQSDGRKVAKMRYLHRDK